MPVVKKEGDVGQNSGQNGQSTNAQNSNPQNSNNAQRTNPPQPGPPAFGGASSTTKPETAQKDENAEPWKENKAWEARFLQNAQEFLLQTEEERKGGYALQRTVYEAQRKKKKMEKKQKEK